MTGQFAALKKVRETLASCACVNVEPATHAALLDAIDELDNAMVAEKRAEYENVKQAPAFTIAPEFTVRMLP